jgi:hypothetical protein
LIWHLYLFIVGILKLLLASGSRNGDWSRSGSEKLDGREVAPLPYKIQGAQNYQKYGTN